MVAWYFKVSLISDNSFTVFETPAYNEHVNLFTCPLCIAAERNFYGQWLSENTTYGLNIF